MKRLAALLAIALLAGLPLALSAEGYDKTAVVAAMRGNAARVGAVNAALGAGDFMAVAQAFFDFAKEAAEMQKMDPPKGSKDDWVKTWQTFQDTALQGVGACGERDAAKAKQALDKLVSTRNYGHQTYRG